jgi:hypothetical protein
MKNRALVLMAIAAALLVVASPALANHAWGSYHWERASNPVNLTIYDCVDSRWDSFLNEAISDWNHSSVINLTKGSGCPTTTRKCSAPAGEIVVCNDTYGNSGWLGIAGISVSGSHITSGYTKLNDTYYCSGCSYDTPEWRDMVTCQEIGHDLGLGHQDENFNNANLNTCMDYTNLPASNDAPNNHDYNQLSDIYSHLDGGSGGGGGGCKGKNCAQAPPAMNDIELDGLGQFGPMVYMSSNGHQTRHELDFGNGFKRITHVTWAVSLLADEDGFVTE